MIDVEPTPWQSRVITCPASVLGIGGARGPGKTEAEIFDWARYQQIYGSSRLRGILTRPTYPQLQEIIAKTRRYFTGMAKWNKSDKSWVFPNSSELVMRYLGKPDDADQYQGHEYPWQGHDDIGNTKDIRTYDMMEGCSRSSTGAPSRTILSFNPAGKLHNQLKRRFVDAGKWGKIIEQDIEIELASGPVKHTRTQCYIHGTLDDNPHITDKNAYIAGIAANNPEWLVKAWLNGDWDIVAGGAIDDVWKRDVHVIPRQMIPAGWRIDRGFDWGSSSPFSVLWYAESNGDPMNGIYYPRGSVFVVREWYGAKAGTENGLRLDSTEIAEGILEKEADWGLEALPGPADNQIYSVIDGKTIAEEMADVGVLWTRSNKGTGSRVAGLNRIRGMLRVAKMDRPEAPGLWIMDCCPRLIGHIPVLTRSEKNPEDIADGQPDHDWDNLRYRVLGKSFKATVGSNPLL